MSTLAIWLFVLIGVLFVATVLLVVRAGFATYRRTRALGNEMTALQGELATVVGSAQARGLSSEDDPV